MPKVTWLWTDELIFQPRSLGFQSLYLFICPFFLPKHLNRIFLATSSGAQGLFCPSAQPFLAYLMSSSNFFALKLHDGCLSSKYCVHTTESKEEGNGQNVLLSTIPPPLPFLLKKKTLSRNFPSDFPLNLIGSFAILRPFTWHLA